MPINPAMLRLAREARQLTQHQLAKLIGIKRINIAKYELGSWSVPDDDLHNLASVLRFTKSFFEHRGQVVGLGGDFLYRRRAAVSAAARRRVQAEVNILRMQVDRILEDYDLEERAVFPTIRPEDMEQNVERIARKVREAWRFPDGPVENLTAAIEAAGGIIFLMDFGTDQIDGTNLRIAGEPPMLFVNKNAPADRHRFNLAHELAHAVMHHSFVLDDAEKQANAFASELLMPRRNIRSDLRNIDLAGAAMLKPIWGVSMAALIRRARDLRQISQSKYQKLFQSLNKNDMRFEEPFPLEKEIPTVFERLIRIHRDEMGLSEEDMKELLFTDRLGKLEERPPLRLKGSLFDESFN